MSIETSAKTALTPSKKAINQNYPASGYNTRSAVIDSGSPLNPYNQNSQYKGSPKMRKSNLLLAHPSDEKKITTRANKLPLADDAPFQADQEVTAIHSYKGKADEHELSFECGDQLKIVKLVAKDPQWALAEHRGKQGYVALNYVKPKSVTMP